VMEKGPASGPGQKAAHMNLSTAVEILNALIEQELPFDMRDLTPEPTFHAPRISVEAVSSNGQRRGSNLDYVWKIIALAQSFGPKDMLNAQEQTRERQARFDPVRELSPE
jgi:hypothetical protein